MIIIRRVYRYTNYKATLLLLANSRILDAEDAPENGDNCAKRLFCLELFYGNVALNFI